MTPEQIRTWAVESRAAQGLPPTVEDPVALRKIANVLALAAGRAQ